MTLKIVNGEEDYNVEIEIERTRFNSCFKKIETIKLLRRIFSIGLKESKVLTENIQKISEDFFASYVSSKCTIKINAIYFTLRSENAHDYALLKSMGISISGLEELSTPAPSVPAPSDTLETSIVKAATEATRFKNYGVALKLLEILVIDFGNSETS